MEVKRGSVDRCMSVPPFLLWQVARALQEMERDLHRRLRVFPARGTFRASRGASEARTTFSPTIRVATYFVVIDDLKYSVY